MKLNKSIISSLVLLIIVGAVYRIIPGRPWGFAPQIAMALFGGAAIKDKRWAFALPVFSMFLSDLLYQALYVTGLTIIPGFYQGQLTNYVLFAGITCIGFLMKRVAVIPVLIYALITPTAYFLVSNGIVWANGGGLRHSKTWAGLLQCYADGVPFYQTSILATLFFSAVFFGGYYLLNTRTLVQKVG